MCDLLKKKLVFIFVKNKVTRVWVPVYLLCLMILLIVILTSGKKYMLHFFLTISGIFLLIIAHYNIMSEYREYYANIYLSDPISVGDFVGFDISDTTTYTTTNNNDLNNNTTATCDDNNNNKNNLDNRSNSNDRL